MIKESKSSDKQDWDKLFKTYVDFYKTQINDEILTIFELYELKGNRVSGKSLEIP